MLEKPTASWAFLFLGKGEIMADILARAYVWLNWGADLLPIQPKSKCIIGGFGSHQKRLRSEAEAFPWFEERRCNIALVLDHGFVAADFDDIAEYWRWVAGPGAGVQTYAELTARGAHVIWRGDALPAGQAPGVEFKNSGALLIAPSVHPSGVAYRITCDFPPANLSFEKAKTLFPFLSEPAFKPYVPKLYPKYSAGGLRGNKLEIIKSKVSVVAELEAAGVKRWRRGGTSIAACCPFHHDTHPSLWAKPDMGIWGCNVSGCPAYGTHDVINARAMRLGLTLPEAIRELWAEVR